MSLSTAELRKAWKAYEAAPAKLVEARIGADKVLVAPETEEAWRAFDAVLSAHKYAVRKADTATYVDKTIKGSTGKSLHAFGLALDLNWNTNPVKYNPKTPLRFSGKASQAERAADVKAGIADTDMSQKMVDDLLAIRTNGGERIFEWGGMWNSLIDTMHFEIDLPPASMKTGVNWATVRAEGNTAAEPAAFTATGLSTAKNALPIASDLKAAESASTPSTAFLDAHAFIQRWEGGFVNDPDDPGGATNYGVTQAVLAQWRGHPVTVEDVRDMTLAEAQHIFHARYWRPMRCDELPYPAALMSYNCGVNSGPGRGGRFLQAALNRQGNTLAVDGSIGDLTIKVAGQADQARLVRDYRDAYEAFYRSLPTWWKFGKGWMNRLNDVSAGAMSAAGGQAVFALESASITLPSQITTDAKPANDIASVTSTTTTQGEPNMTAIDTALGGKNLVGKKTLIAGVAFAIFTALDKFGLLQLADDMKDMVVTLIATYGGLSALSKVERSNSGDSAKK